MTYPETFGGFVVRDEVAQAVVNLLQTPPPGSAYPLIVYHLATVERKQGLQPSSLAQPATYRTGLDFENWQGANLPMLSVVAQPTGQAERYSNETGEGVYGQWYEIQVAAIVEDPTSGDETTAQQLADRYGAAVMLCLTQNGGLGNPAAFTIEKTVLTSAPRTDLIPDAQRWLAMSVTTIRSFVEQVVQESGPISFGPDPYTAPAGWPTITTVDVQLQADDALGNVSPGSGVIVTDSTGHVIVKE